MYNKIISKKFLNKILIMDRNKKTISSCLYVKNQFIINDTKQKI